MPCRPDAPAPAGFDGKGEPRGNWRLCFPRFGHCQAALSWPGRQSALRERADDVPKPAELVALGSSRVDLGKRIGAETKRDGAAAGGRAGVGLLARASVTKSTRGVTVPTQRFNATASRPRAAEAHSESSLTRFGSTMSRPCIALFSCRADWIAGVAGCGHVPGLNEQRMPGDRESRRDNDAG